MPCPPVSHPDLDLTRISEAQDLPYSLWPIGLTSVECDMLPYERGRLSDTNGDEDRTEAKLWGHVKEKRCGEHNAEIRQNSPKCFIRPVT